MGCASKTRMRLASVFSVHSVVSMAIGMLKWLVDTDKSISVVECHAWDIDEVR